MLFKKEVYLLNFVVLHASAEHFPKKFSILIVLSFIQIQYIQHVLTYIVTPLLFGLFKLNTFCHTSILCFIIIIILKGNNLSM